MPIVLKIKKVPEEGKVKQDGEEVPMDGTIQVDGPTMIGRGEHHQDFQGSTVRLMCDEVRDGTKEVLAAMGVSGSHIELRPDDDGVTVTIYGHNGIYHNGESSGNVVGKRERNSEQDPTTQSLRPGDTIGIGCEKSPWSVRTVIDYIRNGFRRSTLPAFVFEVVGEEVEEEEVVSSPVVNSRPNDGTVFMNVPPITSLEAQAVNDFLKPLPQILKDPKKGFESLLKKLRESLPEKPLRACILIRNAQSGDYEESYAYVSSRLNDRIGDLSQTIISKVVESGKGWYAADVVDALDGSAGESLMGHKRLAVCIPVYLQNGNGDGEGERHPPDALVYVDGPSLSGDDSAEQIKTLATLSEAAASFVGVGLQSIKYQEGANMAAKLQGELKGARTIQSALNGQPPENFDGFSFNPPIYEASNQIGGDYVDFIRLSDNRLFVLIADVSGHDLKASLLMVKVSSDLKNILLSNGGDVIDALNKINNDISSTFEGMFVTLQGFVLNGDSGEVQVVNCGHHTPVIRKTDGTTSIFKIGSDNDEDGNDEFRSGPPLGILPEHQYEMVPLTLESGDQVLMTTDAVREAQTEEGNQLGDEAVRQAVASAGGFHDVQSAILNALQNHLNGAPIGDDLAIVSFKKD